MSTAQKNITAQGFIDQYANEKAQLIDGQVVHVVPSLDHGAVQFGFAGYLGPRFGKKAGDGSGNPGGWWFVAEAPVRYGTKNIFLHDLAGWKRDNVPTKPTGYPMVIRPDWVCEILSTNIYDDKTHKRNILHQWEVPFFWLVDPLANTIRILQWEKNEYAIYADVNSSFKGFLPPFGSIEIVVSELFGLED